MTGLRLRPAPPRRPTSASGTAPGSARPGPVPATRASPRGRRLLPGPPGGGQHHATSPTCCGALEDAGARRARRSGPTRCARDADGEVRRARRCAGELGVDVIITSTLAAGSADGAGDGWDVPGLDDLGIPVIQAPASGRSRARLAGRRCRPHPARRGHRRGDPRVRRPHHRPDVRVQGGRGRRRRPPDRRHRRHPGRSRAHRAGWPALAVRTARLAAHARRGPARRRRPVGLPDEAGPPRQRRRARHARPRRSPCSTRCAPPGYRVDRIPDDGDALMDELAAGFTYDQPRLGAGAGGGGGRARCHVGGTAGGSPALPGRPPGRARARCGGRLRATSTSTTARLHFPGHRPRRRARHDPTAPGVRRRPHRHLPRPRPAAAPPLPRLLPVARRADAPRAAGVPTPSSTWASTAPLEWLPGKAMALVAGLLPRRRRRRPAASSTPSSSTTPARGRRPSGGPTPSSSTTCPRR